MKISSESMSLSIDERTERLKKVGVDDAGGPPVPIPNTEVKPCSQGVHPFPYRTRKLSPVVPKIVPWRRGVKIGRRQHKQACLQIFLHSSVGSGYVHLSTWHWTGFRGKNQSEFSKIFRASIALRAMSAFGWYKSTIPEIAQNLLKNLSSKNR